MSNTVIVYIKLLIPGDLNERHRFKLNFLAVVILHRCQDTKEVSSESYMSVIREHAKNMLIVKDFESLLSGSGFYVVGNKAIVGGSKPSVSICSTSQVDSLAFHPD